MIYVSMRKENATYDEFKKLKEELMKVYSEKGFEVSVRFEE